MESIAISKVRPNSENPRYIKDEKFKKLVQSLRDFPEMANVRPIVVNQEMVVLGGNMRLKAMQEAGWKEVPVEVVDWSEEKQREFIIKDNAQFGEWSYDDLANNWDAEDLKEWGLDVWQPEEDLDYSGANQEIDVDNLDGSMTIKLNYTEEDYWKVKQALSKVAETPEDAVCKLLNL